MTKITYPTIVSDALIDIKVAASFHKRLVDLIAALGESVGVDEFKKVLESIKEKRPANNLFEFNVHTILMLIYEIEIEAKKQGKITTAEVDDPDSIDSSKDSSQES